VITTLLKQFFLELEDPLMTSTKYNDFIRVAQVDDDVLRRDMLHALIDPLPDTNFATLRWLILHLNRVAQHSAKNKMTAKHLAIVFGPVLMEGQVSATKIDSDDARHQARVIETILNNTYQVFYSDEEAFPDG
jgi:hypothetical protein